MQIHIAPEDQQKTTFTCPFGTFAYSRMPFGLTMDPAQHNYTTTEKELLAIVFALDKLRSYLLDSRIVVFSDHAALRYLLKKPNAKPRLIRWMLLLQEFNIEVRDKKGAENFVADHLSKIERESEPMPI
ncbi:Retrovirus-related Pol polyprotein from transposon 17.6, partial [Mucuna pruriens]